jgi:glycogen debranching enzyme
MDAQPGKILHETRGGEMARLDEIPFRRYYGTADATPLFVVLAEAYYARTGDRIFIERLWPHVERALHWIDHYGDIDGDGFVEYARHSANGLVQQGWKDSADSVFHRDGHLAQAPIALCEVQGYVYAAKHGAAKLAATLGHLHRAAELTAQAEGLKTHFNDVFWSDEINSYALALDAAKLPCHVVTSNAGHALYTGIATPERARAVADVLLSEPSFSGWGVRTVATGQARYNPMSYHNGSVWPHDNSIIAMGLARYGFQEQALRIFEGLFEASVNTDLHRLPELFCGFPRRRGQGPTLYPVACSPQAWASGSVYMLLQACLGLTFSFNRPQLRFRYPKLPEFLEWVELRSLTFDNSSMDLVFRRHHEHLAASVLRKDEGLEAVVLV